VSFKRFVIPDGAANSLDLFRAQGKISENSRSLSGACIGMACLASTYVVQESRYLTQNHKSLEPPRLYGIRIELDVDQGGRIQAHSHAVKNPMPEIIIEHRLDPAPQKQHQRMAEINLSGQRMSRLKPYVEFRKQVPRCNSLRFPLQSQMNLIHSVLLSVHFISAHPEGRAEGSTNSYWS
jgi:hypothetical protein